MRNFSKCAIFETRTAQPISHPCTRRAGGRSRWSRRGRGAPGPFPAPWRRRSRRRRCPHPRRRRCFWRTEGACGTRKLKDVESTYSAAECNNPAMQPLKHYWLNNSKGFDWSVLIKPTCKMKLQGCKKDKHGETGLLFNRVARSIGSQWGPTYGRRMDGRVTSFNPESKDCTMQNTSLQRNYQNLLPILASASAPTRRSIFALVQYNAAFFLSFSSSFPPFALSRSWTVTHSLSTL